MMPAMNTQVWVDRSLLENAREIMLDQLAEIERLTAELDRTENQIHEDGGFIDTVVNLEAERDQAHAEIEQGMLRNAISQIAELEAEVEKFKAHSMELNHVYWRLAIALGWVDEGDGTIDCDPEELMTEVEGQLWYLRAIGEA